MGLSIVAAKGAGQVTAISTCRSNRISDFLCVSLRIVWEFTSNQWSLEVQLTLMDDFRLVISF
jgi:hypothetical protein